MIEGAAELTDTNFKDEVDNATGILFFYKKLCPNCKAMKAVIEKFTLGKNEFSVMQIDSESNPVAMAVMSVERVPTLLIVKEGKVVATKVGLMNVRELTAMYNTA